MRTRAAVVWVANVAVLAGCSTDAGKEPRLDAGSDAVVTLDRSEGHDVGDDLHAALDAGPALIDSGLMDRVRVEDISPPSDGSDDATTSAADAVADAMVSDSADAAPVEAGPTGYCATHAMAGVLAGAPGAYLCTTIGAEGAESGALVARYSFPVGSDVPDMLLPVLIESGRVALITPLYFNELNEPYFGPVTVTVSRVGGASMGTARMDVRPLAPSAAPMAGEHLEEHISQLLAALTAGPESANARRSLQAGLRIVRAVRAQPRQPSYLGAMRTSSMTMSMTIDARALRLIDAYYENAHATRPVTAGAFSFEGAFTASLAFGGACFVAAVTGASGSAVVVGGAAYFLGMTVVAAASTLPDVRTRYNGYLEAAGESVRASYAAVRERFVAGTGSDAERDFAEVVDASTEGATRCEAGEVECGTAGCVNVDSNDLHCGACDQACSAGDYCFMGRCMTTSSGYDAGGGGMGVDF